jgi:hypothetical protein
MSDGTSRDLAHGTITDASLNDVAEIADLAEQRRRDYESAQPQFWRVAADATEQHTPFIARLVEDPSVVSLVARDGERFAGYLFANLVEAPPVLAPGGPSGFIDDFSVALPTDWPVVGSGLLHEARQRLVGMGATQVVAVCGHHDTAKMNVLRACGLAQASEWLVAPL